MPQSPRLHTESQTTKRPRTTSAPVLLITTALDTTWRAFVPTIGGTFLGIGIDHWLGIAPIGTIICLIGGVALSTLLIAMQIKNVRKSS